VIPLTQPLTLIGISPKLSPSEGESFGEMHPALQKCHLIGISLKLTLSPCPKTKCHDLICDSADSAAETDRHLIEALPFTLPSINKMP